MGLKVYQLTYSPPVRAVRMLLGHLAIPDVEYVDLDFANGDHLKEDFLKIPVMYEGERGLRESTVAEVRATYALMEALVRGPWVAGPLTVADMCWVASLSSLDIGVPLDHRFPKLEAWYKRCIDLECYKTMAAEGLEQLREIIMSKLKLE